MTLPPLSKLLIRPKGRKAAYMMWECDRRVEEEKRRRQKEEQEEGPTEINANQQRRSEKHENG